MGGEQEGGERLGVGSRVAHRHKVAHGEGGAGEALRQHVGGAAEVAHDVHRLHGTGIGGGEGGDGEGRFAGKERLLRGEGCVAGGGAEQGGKRGLLETVEAVLHDDVGGAVGGLFVHHGQVVRARLRRQEAAGFDHQPRTERAGVLVRHRLRAAVQGGHIQRGLEGGVVDDAHAAAEVDVFHGAVEDVVEAECQGEAVFVVVGEDVRREVLGAEVDVEPADIHGQGGQQLTQRGEVGLVDAELGRAVRAAVHVEGGVDAKSDGLTLAPGGGDGGDALHLADGVGDQVAAVPRGGEGAIRLAGGGEVDVLLCHAALGGEGDLAGGGGVRSDAQRGKGLQHRREGVRLDGKQNVEAGEGAAELLRLCGENVAGVEVAGRMLTRQRDGVFVHGAPSFTV